MAVEAYKTTKNYNAFIKDVCTNMYDVVAQKCYIPNSNCVARQLSLSM